MAVCSNCATMVPDEAKFCPACGQAIIMNEVQPVITEQEPTQFQEDTTIPQEGALPQEEQNAETSYYTESQTSAPQQGYYAEPQAPEPQQSYYAEPQAPAPQQTYYAQPQAPAPQQSYYAQPQAPAPQQNYYTQPQAPVPQQSYYAQPQAPAPQQSYYAQPQNQAPQQSYYAQPGSPAQPQNQQNYYAQQNPNQQQNYYAQQNGTPPQQNNYGYQQNYQQQAPNYQAGPQDVAENKGLCVLSYLGILMLIPLLSKPNSQYVKYHSNQGLVLILLEIAISILTMIPYLGWFVIGPLGYIFTLVCVIMGIINTVNGQMKPLPLIGNITLIK